MDVLDPLLDPWRSGIDRRALFEVILLGSFCGALGFWVVTERLTYSAESLAHGLLPGLVLAALAGAPLLLGAAGGVLVAAALIALAAGDDRIGADTATAVVVTGLVGLGAVLALSPEAPQRLQELLFGDPLGVTDADLIAAAVLALAGGAALVALHRPLTATAFGSNPPPGIRPSLVRLALLGLLAAAVAVAVQGLGALLVLAVLVAPPVAVRAHASSAPAAIRAAALVGALGGIAGIYLSVHAGTAAGASIALALCAAAAVGAALPRLRQGVTGRRASRRL
jgi:ABC-type Mn2+/Zn2+ transport system permease subunit